jgi:hypothetical protein
VYAKPPLEMRLVALRQALVDGERSGEAGDLNIPAIIREARREAGIDGSQH